MADQPIHRPTVGEEYAESVRRHQIIPGVPNALTAAGMIGGYQTYKKFDHRQEEMLQTMIRQQQIMLFQMHQQQCGPNCDHFPVFDEQVVDAPPQRTPGPVEQIFVGLIRLGVLSVGAALAVFAIWISAVFIMAFIHAG